MSFLFNRQTRTAPGPLGQQGQQQQVDLLQFLLGLPSTTGAGAAGGGGAGLFGQATGGRQAGGAGGAGQFGQTGGDPLQRLTQFFGQLSPFTSDAQRGGTGISQFLNQPAPEQRALDVALPGLQEILTGGGPQFERDLSLANQQGGRFGSANAILRGEAFRNLFNARQGAAQTLGLLAQGAGGGQARQAGFADLETQRRLQILMQLLGVGQQAAFNQPTLQQPSIFEQLAGGAAGIGALFGGGGGA